MTKWKNPFVRIWKNLFKKKIRQKKIVQNPFIQLELFYKFSVTAVCDYVIIYRHKRRARIFDPIFFDLSLKLYIKL